MSKERVSVKGSEKEHDEIIGDLGYIQNKKFRICENEVDYCLSQACNARIAVEGIPSPDAITLRQKNRAENYLQSLIDELRRIRVRENKK